ncbi:MAG TPA: methylated-DNA--[protein]-cysteine S-methyltransferase [Nitrospiraceae bacterium]|nr:methylated-DNA--[protein]-cysteine S-methyltransferase [Nitrospiraceae bacterium]
MSTTSVFQTPWGWMGVGASEYGIQSIVLPRPSRQAVYDEWLGSHSERAEQTGQNSAEAKLVREVQTQLMAFLANQRREMDFPLDLSRGTPFQRRVWRAILRIPYGRVRSYRWVADRVGGAHYARAVGNALGANPVPIIVPCHRIVASDGSLGGFTGGLPVKRKLLQLEGTLAQLNSGASREAGGRGREEDQR